MKNAQAKGPDDHELSNPAKTKPVNFRHMKARKRGKRTLDFERVFHEVNNPKTSLLHQVKHIPTISHTSEETKAL